MYRFETSIDVPTSLEEAWNFFSNPENLKELTPPSIGFEPRSKSMDTKMYPGFFITYKVAPLFGVKMTWATEITHVENQKFFIDEQRLGPYKIWHHEHHFEPLSETVTRVTDIVHYALPAGFIGRLFHPLVIKPKLLGLFSYREQQIKEIFDS
ncbi:MAG: SRPBCC family protein [Flavobacteriales bacterium]|nr:SRPBCC family protein [Flavobacteriales bacterium]